jgi:hypothetical protein
MTKFLDAAVVAMAAGLSSVTVPQAEGSVVDRPASTVPSPPMQSSAPETLAPDGDAGQHVQASAERDLPSVACLASTICAVKQRVRWRTAPWTASYCHRIAQSMLEAAERERLSPALLLAVMINESSLDAYATRPTMKGNTLYAKDGGLMGIRCIVDSSDRCTNGRLRGMRWSEVIRPETNIALGARALAYWRDAGGVIETTSRVRQPSGEVTTRTRYRRCLHKDHAYWAHYNHGERYISRGPARHYPHRVGVLYYALARAMSLETQTQALMSMPLSMSDAGRRPRTADRPVEPRHVSLCRSISSIGPVCDEGLTARRDEAPAVQSARYSSQVSRAAGETCTPPDGQGG